jgi:hypothetical protein
MGVEPTSFPFSSLSPSLCVLKLVYLCEPTCAQLTLTWPIWLRGFILPLTWPGRLRGFLIVYLKASSTLKILRYTSETNNMNAMAQRLNLETFWWLRILIFLAVTSVPKCKRKKERSHIAQLDHDSAPAPPAPT